MNWMTRIKQSTVAKIDEIGRLLRETADELEDARPHLPSFLRSFASAFESAACVKSAEFSVTIQQPYYFESLDQAIWIRRDSPTIK